MSLDELFNSDLPFESLFGVLSSDDPMSGSWDPPSAPSAKEEEEAAHLLQGTVSLPSAPAQTLELLERVEDTTTAAEEEANEGEGLVVTVPRHRLVKMSRADFDSFVRNATCGRKLTKEEVLEVRRQRKLIKNRLSASVCRKRKRAQVSQMEAKIKALEERLEAAAALEQKAHQLEEKNRQLAERVQELEKAAAHPSAPLVREPCVLTPTTTPETLDLTLMRKILECSPALLQMYKQLQFYQKQLSCSSLDMKKAAVILTYTMAELNLLLAANLNSAKLTAAYNQDPSIAPFASVPAHSIPAPCLAPAKDPMDTTTDAQPAIDRQNMELLASFLAHKSAETAAAAARAVEAPACTAAPL